LSEGRAIGDDGIGMVELRNGSGELGKTWKADGRRGRMKGCWGVVWEDVV